MRRRVLLLLTLLIGLAIVSAQPAGWSASRQGGGHAPLTRNAIPMSATAGHNRADVMFLTEMIVHHRQAVHMAELAKTRARHTQLKRLARAIKTAQTREVGTMTRWLRAWRQPVPRAGGHHAGADMARLEAARGVEFDRLFLTMMIAHHQEAIAMAITERAHGVNPGARRLAATIQRDQQREIVQMRAWLRAWNLGRVSSRP